MAIDFRMLELLGGMAATPKGASSASRASQADPLKALTADPAYRAFDMEMKMMQNLFSSDSGGSGEGFGMSMNPLAIGSAMDVGDERMYDALATISRLFNKQQLTRGTFRPEQYGKAVAKTTAQPKPDPLPMNSTGRIKADNTTYEVVGGELSAVFESGNKGVSCIGYDRVGGTSYGTFQIASRTGSMDRFVRFLKREAPDIAKELRVGAYNTGSRRGSVPRAWKQVAEAQPDRFEKLQRDFIRQDHYVPARDKILAATGVDINEAPVAVQEVLWSTSVQHGAGGASRIFSKAIARAGMLTGEPDFERLVSKVYASRKHQFDSSSSRVRRSVQNRLSREQEIALSMLRGSHRNQMV